MPPIGLVIKGMPTPLAIIINPQNIFIKNLRYGERSNLSSKTPVIRANREAVKRARVIFVKGKNRIPAKAIPIKRGTPPPLGIGFLWIIAGCLWVLGSSKSPNFLIKIKEMGVAMTVVTKAVKKGKKTIVS